MAFSKIRRVVTFRQSKSASGLSMAIFKTLGLRFFQDDPVVEEVHLLNPRLDPFLLSEDILQVEALCFRTQNRNILKHQLFLALLQDVGVRFAPGSSLINS